MIQKDIIEQINTLFKILKVNKNIMLVSIFAIITLILLEIVGHLKNKKITKIILISVYILVFGLLFIFYNSEVLSFIDYLVNNIFILLFFPNLAVYTLVIIISNILVIKNLLRTNNKILKHISIMFFVIFNIIFYLIVDNCVENNILVYETLSIYTNSELLTLIEINMYLFILYLIIILISKVSHNIIGSIKVPTKAHEVSKVNTLVTDTIEVEDELVDTKENSIPDLNLTPVMITPEEIVKPNENSIVLNNHELNNLKTVNIYNEYMDIEPVKKKKIRLSNMDELFVNNNMNHDMNVVFGTENYLDNIMNDIFKLRGNVNNQNQIRKIYEQITINSKNLTLQDYNYLINTLKEIRNSN